MFTEKDIIHAMEYHATQDGKPLVWVIDGQCLYDLPVPQQYLFYFEYSDRLENVSHLYPEHDGIVIRFFKENVFLDDFATSEYFGSILLSNPQMIDLNKYPYGRYVVSPYAQFDGEKFIITNRDLTGFPPF